MQITANWLREYLDPAPSNEELLRLLPLIGLELEETRPLPGGDYLLTIAILANRPDCLGVFGVAREVAASLKSRLVPPQMSLVESGEPASGSIRVSIEDTHGCPRYLARVIRGVKVGPSPAWLADRLNSIGGRLINNVVDVTNYVMRETSQPLHAFDLHCIRGGEIIVRRMTPDERLQLLDGAHVKVGATPLAICDGEGPVALAGIMGGKDSETTADSVDILLEAANFDPVDIRKSARELGLATEASYRFERGMDPNQTVRLALDRAAALIAELGGGLVAPGIVDCCPAPSPLTVHRLTMEEVSRILGHRVTMDEVHRALEPLGMIVVDEQLVSTTLDGDNAPSAAVMVTAPSWRMDCSHRVALIEDIARMTGFDREPTSAPSTGHTPGSTSTLGAIRSRLLHLMVDLGCVEGRNSPMLPVPPAPTPNEGEENGKPITLVNPISADMAGFRTALLPSVLAAASSQAKRGQDSSRHFEIDRVFSWQEGKPQERWHIAASVSGKTHDTDWSGSSANQGFWHLKGSIETLMERMGVGELTWRPATHNDFRLRHTAEVIRGDVSLGIAGEIDPKTLGDLKLSGPVFGFELDLDAICGVANPQPRFAKPPKMPAVVRDIALVVSSKVSYTELEALAKQSAGELLEQIACLDVYEGKHVEEGHRSVALRLKFRATDRTLVTEEVADVVDNVVRALTERFGARLRT